MTQQPVTNQTNATWLAESLRLTAFPSPSAQIDATGWWENVVGHPPENQNIQPRKGFREEYGRLGNGRLTLVIQPIRIDWHFLTAIDEDSEAPIIDQLASFSTALEIFQPVVDQWLKMTPSLSRLAFGAVLVIPVNDKQEGYRRLNSYLSKMELDPEGSSDFLYQINRPRSSKTISNLTINRLAKWSVALRTVGQISILGLRMQYMATAPETISIRLELDINTAAEFKDELTPSQFPSLFQELVKLGEEISTKGDIP